MKKLIALIALISAFGLSAADTTLTMAGAGTNSVIGQSIRINTATITGTTSATTVAFFDAPSTNFTFTNAAFTTYSTVYSNMTYITTNYTGIKVTNTAYATVTTAVTNPNNTNSYHKVYTFVVPANETLVVPFASGLFMNFGLLVTNDYSSTLSLSYGLSK
jgi:hypothetical protein